MRLVLFVEPEPVEAVLAVLEMVLAIVWLLGRLRHWDSAPCATGEEFKGRRDVPWGRGSLVCVCTRSPRRAAQRSTDQRSAALWPAVQRHAPPRRAELR